MKRRAFVLAGVGGVGALTLGLSWRQHVGIRLRAHPRKPSGSLKTGLHKLGLGDAERDGLVYVPATLDAKSPAPLVLALHGATQDARVMATPLAPLADALGCPIIAPDSRAITWDGIRGEFGVDIAFIDRALAWAFDRCLVDPKRIWLAGFSDGASYGLALGLSNGDLFSRMLLFSPGFIPDGVEPSTAKPKIFWSHGTEDQILPIDRTSRLLVPMVKKAGYDVTYNEFTGRHGFPPPIVAKATEWLKSG